MKASRSHIDKLVGSIFLSWSSMFLFAAFFLSCSASSLGSWDRSPIDLTSDGYTGILVAIDRSVPYNETFVENLQSVLSRASSVLYNATDQRAFFGHINVIVPRTWPEQPSYMFATKWTQDNANIIIRSTSNDSSSYPPFPFVRQPGRCGQPGEYMHLPAELFTSSREDTGKAIVHEWAHLRWGLFDEYPLSSDDQFYISNNGTTEGTRCSEAVTGYAARNRATNSDRNRKPGKCHFTDGELPPRNCHFRPYPNEEQTASGSLMYSTSMPSITGFCRSSNSSDDDPSMLHVPEAPTQQNRQCQGQSTWDVMLSSPDFENGRNSPQVAGAGNMNSQNTTPTFTFIRHKPRTILIIDRSAAMGNGEAWRNVVSICERFITEASEDSQVGMLFYTNYSYSSYTVRPTLYNMTLSGKQQLLAFFNKTKRMKGSVGSSPSQALRISLRMLPRDRKAVGTDMLIFSGWQNNIDDVWIELYVSHLRRRGVNVRAVDFGSDDTGVRSISIPRVLEPSPLFAFNPPAPGDDAVEDSHHEYMFHDMANNPLFLQVFRQRVGPVIGRNITIDVTIDGTISRYTTFRISCENGTAPEVEVTAPSGTVFKGSAGEADWMTGSSRGEINLRIPGISEKGKWRVGVVGSGYANQSLDVQVFSAPTHPGSPAIRARPIILSRQANVPSSRQLIFYGEVMLGENPVIGANVTMAITGPRDHHVTIPLRDNGIGGDTRANDGIYSAYFTQFSDNGTYRLDMNVFGDNATVRNISFLQASGTPKVWDSLDQPTTGDIEIDPFMRAPSQVEIEVIGDVASLITNDSFPPARISDLEVLEFDANSRSARLRWTAVGDDYETGTASRYEIRYSNDTRSFARSFESGVEMVNDSGLQSPSPSFQIELVAVILPANYCSPVCAIRLRAVDDQGNSGEPSNMVTVIERLHTTTAGTTQYSHTTGSNSISTSMTTGYQTTEAPRMDYTEESVLSVLNTEPVDDVKTTLRRKTTKGMISETKFTVTVIAIITMFCLLFLSVIVMYSVCKRIDCNDIFSNPFRDVSGFQWARRNDQTSSADVEIELSTPSPKKKRVKVRISDALIIEDF